ncbi:tyrosine-type recombinase/integrase [Conexibacter sp. W3-3-2]|uniref:tyrosine-type recombinase/integrase n=1 Tax=Conexibacter sp. W3-3-2 TaxID=2675227 RepID=UPI0012B6ADB0|nr:site-specific integrase [Conexibacter sp. W3-3-2]MTD47331.1 tyrosine-type recombinase/integrase [Conexibacter sp. W3-3-2]
MGSDLEPHRDGRPARGRPPKLLSREDSRAVAATARRLLADADDGDVRLADGAELDGQSLALVLLRADLAPRTREAYARDLVEFAGFLARRGRQDLLEATAEDVDDFRRRLEATGAAKGTQARKRATLSRYYGLAVERRLIGASPVQASSRVRVDVAKHQRQQPALARDEQRELLALAAKAGADVAAAVRLMSQHALRASEVCALNVSDLQGTRLRIHGKGATAGVQDVELSGPIVELLEDLAKEREPDEPLVRSPTGRRYSRQNLSQRVKRLTRTLTPTSAHGLRATYVTRAAALGVPLQDIAAGARHKNIATTQRYLREHDPAAASRRLVDDQG